MCSCSARGRRANERPRSTREGEQRKKAAAHGAESVNSAFYKVDGTLFAESSRGTRELGNPHTEPVVIISKNIGMRGHDAKQQQGRIQAGRGIRRNAGSDRGRGGGHCFR